jgi:hypothetical protein
MFLQEPNRVLNLKLKYSIVLYNSKHKENGIFCMAISRVIHWSLIEAKKLLSPTNLGVQLY